MLTDKRGRRVSELAGPSSGGPWPLPRPPLPTHYEGWEEAGYEYDRRTMRLCPRWRCALTRTILTFKGDHWTAERWAPRALGTGNTAPEAFHRAHRAR